MGRYNKVCKLAQDKGITVRDLFVKVLLTPQKKQEIVEKMNKLEDEEYEPDDLYQMCDTPRSQKDLLRFF